MDQGGGVWRLRRVYPIAMNRDSTEKPVTVQCSNTISGSMGSWKYGVRSCKTTSLAY